MIVLEKHTVSELARNASPGGKQTGERIGTLPGFSRSHRTGSAPSASSVHRKGLGARFTSIGILRSALAAIAASALIACGSGEDADVGTANDSGVAADMGTPDIGTAPDTSSVVVQSCDRGLGTCQEFHDVPSGDVEGVCGAGSVVNGPCTRVDAVGGCRTPYTIGFVVLWGYGGSAGSHTEATMRSYCANETPPGTFLSP